MLRGLYGTPVRRSVGKNIPRLDEARATTICSGFVEAGNERVCYVSSATFSGLLASRLGFSLRILSDEFALGGAIFSGLGKLFLVKECLHHACCDFSPVDSLDHT